MTDRPDQSSSKIAISEIIALKFQIAKMRETNNTLNRKLVAKDTELCELREIISRFEEERDLHKLGFELNDDLINDNGRYYVVRKQATVLNIPKSPGIPDIPKLPEIPNIPKLPEIPNIPKPPEIPNMPDISNLIKNSRLSEFHKTCDPNILDKAIPQNFSTNDPNIDDCEKNSLKENGRED